MTITLPHELVVFDLETTGLSPQRDGIVEIGAMKIIGGQLQPHLTFAQLVRPTTATGEVMPIPYYATRIHGITDAAVRLAPTLDEVLPDFLAFVGGAGVVAHNISFDNGFIQVAAQRRSLNWQPPARLCTVQLSRQVFSRERSHSLDALAQRLGLEFAPGGRHRSLGDVEVTAQAFLALIQRLGA